jgi:hypothetical protein
MLEAVRSEADIKYRLPDSVQGAGDTYFAGKMLAGWRGAADSHGWGVPPRDFAVAR